MDMTLVRECLEYGRQFLNRYDLRILKDINPLPYAALADISTRLIEPYKTTRQVKEYMYEIFFGWHRYCVSQNQEHQEILREIGDDYVAARGVNVTDPFKGCYFSDGTITAAGLELRVETRGSQEPEKRS